MKKQFLVYLILFIFGITLFAQKTKKLYKKEVKYIMKVAMIIAKDGFRDEEYLEPKKILSNAGIEIVTVSSSSGTAKGMLGATVKVDKLIDEIKVEDFNGIIFIGGVGSSEYWDNPTAHKIAQEAIKQKKLLAAICIAPVTLARAGVLKGKKATVFSSEINELKKSGAVYTGKDVEVDGLIVTGAGPHAAKQFGEKIKELLFKK